MLKAIPKISMSRRVHLFLMILGLAGLISTAAIAHADQYDDKINALQTQNANSQNIINGLAAQASSYQDAISQLNGEIASIQAALALNQSKQASLQAQITADAQKITEEKGLLGDVIRSMYINGQLTTIEELATSNSLSDYVDQQENQTLIQNKLNSLIQEITALQVSQQQQKDQLDVVVKTEQEQNDQLSSDQSQQQSLLSYNQGQQDAYNQQIQANQSQIATLRAEQIAANRALVSNDGGHVISSGTCGGGYPAQAVNGYGSSWGCDYPLDNTIDNWGMYNRECVSYTAWKVYQTYGYMPYWGGSGDANQWPGDAEAAGIPVGTTPKVGSVAIYMGGASDPWGHAMWVVGVNGDTITVDQYNLYYDGNFYETTINGAGLTYIYFGG
jgi:surface antigen/peptidoglycan hydrolase CwlO-like protein